MADNNWVWKDGRLVPLTDEAAESMGTNVSPVFHEPKSHRQGGSIHPAQPKNRGGVLQVIENWRMAFGLTIVDELRVKPNGRPTRKMLRLKEMQDREVYDFRAKYSRNGRKNMAPESFEETLRHHHPTSKFRMKKIRNRRRKGDTLPFHDVAH